MRRLVRIGLVASVLLAACSTGEATPTGDPTLAASQEKAAQSNLRNAMAAAKTYFTDSSTYSGWSPSTGSSIEPSLTWRADEPATVDKVTIDFVDPTHIVMSTMSASGTPFCIADDAEVGTSYGTVDAHGATAASACTGDAWGS